jgi:hypothetical protein
MEERHERVLAAAHLALAALLQQAATPPPAPEGEPPPAGGCARLGRRAPQLLPACPPTAPERSACAAACAAGASARDTLVEAQQQELLQQLAAIVGSASFYKRSVAAKSAPVRQAAYVVVSRACQHAPAILDATLGEASAAVLGALHDREPANHGPMWEMVLAFAQVGGLRWPDADGVGRGGLQGLLPCSGYRCLAQARVSATQQPRILIQPWPCPRPSAPAHAPRRARTLPRPLQVRPGCWQLLNYSKAVLPRLWSLLRHGCHGSATGSFPALLPLLALMPAEVVGPSTQLLEQLLGSVWTGLKACSTRWGPGLRACCVPCTPLTPPPTRPPAPGPGLALG